MTENNDIQKVAVLTLGCSKNLVDSEKLLALLEGKSFELTEDVNEADAVIVNTCGFIKSAKEESVNLILQAAELKRRKKIKKLIVFGCLTERYPDIKSEISSLDGVYGVEAYKEILNSLGNSYKSDYGRVLLTPPHYSYLKIAEGCNHQCSFCAIPAIRGSYVSRPIDEIVREAKGLVINGVQELNIIAQDSTSYGRDLYGESKLAELLKRVADINDLKWLRLLYTYPTNFPKGILKVMAERSNICKYLDIPLQHISDSVLSSMRRGSNKLKINSLIEDIRATIPDVALRTTFIVGYPTETEADFEELYNFIEKVEFDRLGVFAYSHEEGTTAYKLGDIVPDEVKNYRLDAIMKLQQRISLKKNKALIGKDLDVIIDDINDKYYIGRTMHDAPEIDNGVIIKTKKRFTAGAIIKATVTNAEEYDLHVEYPPRPQA